MAGRDECLWAGRLLLPCSQSGALWNMYASLLQARPPGTCQITANPEKWLQASGVDWLAEFSTTIFQNSQSCRKTIKSSSFKFPFWFPLWFAPNLPQHPEGCIPLFQFQTFPGAGVQEFALECLVWGSCVH